MAERALFLANWLWRLVITGLTIASIFFGGFVLVLLVLPLALVSGRSAESLAPRVIHQVFRWYARNLVLCGVIRIEFTGTEKLGDRRMIIANHPTLLDVVLLLGLFPNAQCVIKHSLYTHRFMGPLMRCAGYISNEASAEALISACRVGLAQGRTLVIFPEGTRSIPGAMQPQFLRGFANVATLTGQQVQPVFITCTPPILFKGEPWWRIPKIPPTFRVEVGDCVDVNPFLASGSRNMAARRLVKHMEDYYADKLAQALLSQALLSQGGLSHVGP